MKKKIIMIFTLVFTAMILASCGKSEPLLIWVGSESVDFYKAQMEAYVEDYAKTNGEDFPHEISVVAVDTGTAASTYLEDMEAGADIFTVAHDNLGKLTSGSSGIAPITDEALLQQINDNNSETFLDVIKNSVGGTTYTFGAPYIAQSLVLYYNKAFLNETDVLTWESILAKAKTSNKQALSLSGVDGFNNSFLLLATNAETGASSLKLYDDGDITKNDATGDDIVSIMKWGQRFFTDPNGAKSPTDSGWEVELKDNISIAFIGGAWHYNAASSALGSNLGITILPTFTITQDDAYGTVTAGTTFRSGTFADAKVFVMKKNSKKADYLQDIVKYLTTPEMQEKSYVAADNLPAYKNAAEEFEAMKDNPLAKAQLQMFDYGRPQPFGYDNKYNFYYYSKGGPEFIMEILENKTGTTSGGFETDAAILAQLQKITSIWITGSAE